VGAAQVSHNTETSVGEFHAATDEKGVFQITNVPPGDSLVLYGLMSSMSAHGAVRARAVSTGKSGSVSDVGDLQLTPGHKLSGRLVLADGKPVPTGTRILLSREEAWDSAQATADKEGHFGFAGLPSELYSLGVKVNGYHLSPKNVSIDLFGFS